MGSARKRLACAGATCVFMCGALRLPAMRTWIRSCPRLCVDIRLGSVSRQFQRHHKSRRAAYGATLGCGLCPYLPCSIMHVLMEPKGTAQCTRRLSAVNSDCVTHTTQRTPAHLQLPTTLLLPIPRPSLQTQHDERCEDTTKWPHRACTIHQAVRWHAFNARTLNGRRPMMTSRVRSQMDLMAPYFSGAATALGASSGTRGAAAAS